MQKVARILLHLTALLVGWGIARPLLPVAPEPAGKQAVDDISLGKTSAREAGDQELGEALLRRLVPDVAPSPPAVVVRHEGSLAERMAKAGVTDPFADDYPDPDGPALSYLRNEIRETLFGKSGPDFSYAFRRGRMEAPQVTAALGEIFPDLAGEKLFARAVFVELYRIDPVRATIPLYSQNQKERDSCLRATLGPSMWDKRPDKSLARLNLELEVGEGSAVVGMLSSGTYIGSEFHGAFGNDYAEWLLLQPPSKGRDRMLNDLVAMLEKQSPAVAEELKTRIPEP